MLSSWNRVSLLKGLEPGAWTVELVQPARDGQQILDERAVEVRAGRTERVVFRR
jgi:hypothetical protein